MEFFRKQPTIDFMGLRFAAFTLTVVLILASLVSIALRGVNWGLDFTGGTLVELHFTEPADLDAIREALAENGFGEALAQNFGSVRDVLVRVAPEEGVSSAQTSDRIIALMPGAEMRRVEYVGPQVGDELADRAVVSLLCAFAAVMLYVMMRFESRLALAAIVASLHDAIITAGLLSISGLSFDITAVAGLLTVIGYSINDTIVVFDRIRENFRKHRKLSAAETVNLSINETLSRTLMTSLCAFITVFALLIWGGETIRTFSFTMAAGIIVGTFSSIYVAAPFAIMLGVNRSLLMPVSRDAVDSRP
jgi:preprotein translocase subunit SecF